MKLYDEAAPAVAALFLVIVTGGFALVLVLIWGLYTVFVAWPREAREQAEANRLAAIEHEHKQNLLAQCQRLAATPNAPVLLELVNAWSFPNFIAALEAAPLLAFDKADKTAFFEGAGYLCLTKEQAEALGRMADASHYKQADIAARVEGFLTSKVQAENAKRAEAERVLEERRDALAAQRAVLSRPELISGVESLDFERWVYFFTDYQRYGGGNLNNLFYHYAHEWDDVRRLDMARHNVSYAPYIDGLAFIERKHETRRGTLHRWGHVVLPTGTPLDRYAELPIHMGTLNRKFADYLFQFDGSTDTELHFWRHNGLAEPELFNRHAEQLARYLGFPVMAYPFVSQEHEEYLVLAKLEETTMPTVPLANLPAVIPFRHEHLKQGALFLGANIVTGEDVFMPLADMAHLLVAGQPGGGKSVFVNALLLGCLYNIKAFEKLYLVDLKAGVEFAPYDNVSPKIEVVDDYNKLPEVVDGILQTVEDRLARMRGKTRTSREPYILLVIDEYAVIQLQSFATKEDTARHKKLLATLSRLAMIGRAANLRIVASLQKATTDAMDASFKTNLAMRALFRVYESQTVVQMFGDAQELPVKAADLKAGQFIFESGKSERVVLQAAFVPDELAPRLRTEAAA